MVFEPKCREICTDEEYAVMKKAFFEKKKNLDDCKGNLYDIYYRI